MLEIERYLAELDDRLDVEPEARVEIVAEVRGHLLAAAQAEREAGCDPAEAARRAVERFGSAAEVARRMNRAYEESRQPVRVGPLLMYPRPEEARLRQRVLRSVVGAVGVAVVFLYMTMPASLRPSQPVLGPLLLAVIALAPLVLPRLSAALSTRHIVGLAWTALGLMVASALYAFATSVYGLHLSSEVYLVQNAERGLAVYGLLFLVLPVAFSLVMLWEIRQLRTRRDAC